ncbi:MAG TPA: 3-methyladenine DNA glycosylase [Candidatus Taylorbacteria bacterium]|nr:3-methyladenine DNA glycosylase [Candidatus Taylorbacteria bacterium]
MRRILETPFFDQLALNVGRELMGKYLVRVIDGREVALPITEVEVYDGFEDRASHAFRGRTQRNQVMFGDAGYLYVYFVYGRYWMLNIVVGKKDYPAAILIRGAGDIAGPGKLSRFLSIDKRLNGKLALPASGLWFEDRGKRVLGRHIKRAPRIGVSYAGPLWSKKLYRFVLKTPSRK